jgi:tetratricopeptide (TPR) repeat protein
MICRIVGLVAAGLSLAGTGISPAGGIDVGEIQQNMEYNQRDLESKIRNNQVSPVYLDEKTSLLYQQAKDLFREGRYAEAKEMFSKVARRSPRLGECHGYLGQIYLEQEKNYSRAIEHLIRAVRYCQKDHKHISLYYLALAYEGAGRRSEAVKTWEEYLKVCSRGSSWESQAKEHCAALKTTPVPARTP